MSNSKFAVVSHITPPSYSGQAIMLRRLLEQAKSDEYLLVATKNQRKNAKTNKALPGKTLTLMPSRRINLKLFGFLFKPLNLFLEVKNKEKQIFRIIHDFNLKTIVVCSGDFTDLPAGYLASRKTKTRLVSYFFDDYMSQWSGIMSFLAKLITKRIVKDSYCLIVPNEFLKLKYMKINKNVVIVRNPIAPLVKAKPDKRLEGKKKIIYTGAIYQAQMDAFINLSKAILEIPQIAVHIFTNQPEEELPRILTTHPQIFFHKHIQESDVLAVQKQADFLFLPLSFASEYPEIIRTSAPGKMGEYLSAGRPILVHAPSDSFATNFLSSKKSAIVVDKPSVALLAKTIKKALENPDQAKKIADNASKLSKEFSQKLNAKRFLEAVR